jgi:hypothetical protein
MQGEIRECVFLYLTCTDQRGVRSILTMSRAAARRTAEAKRAMAAGTGCSRPREAEASHVSLDLSCANKLTRKADTYRCDMPSSAMEMECSKKPAAVSTARR